MPDMVRLGLDPGRRSLAPYILLLVGWVAMMWMAGVSVPDLTRYAAYEAAFVLVPGVLLASALLPNLRPGLLLFSIGAGLGLALELGAYVFTAMVGGRAIFVVYPFVVIASALLLMRRGGGVPSDRAVSTTRPGAWHACVVVIALQAIGLLALGSFPLSPAVGPGSSPVYDQDLIFNMSIAAELQHRIPPTVPQVAGLPLVYHWFVNAHLTAVASVTGVELWTLVSRLFPTFWLAIIVVQVAAVGSALSGRHWAGPLAALCIFALGELDLSLSQAIPFHGTFRSNLWQSPSFLFGLIVFMPTVLLLAPGAPRQVRGPPSGRWLVAAALTAACLGAKATILPLLVGAGVFATGVAWFRQRPLAADATRATILAGGLLVMGLLTLYLGGATGFFVSVLGSLTRTPAWRSVVDTNTFRALEPLAGIILGAVVLSALLAPIAGIVLLDRGRATFGPRPWLAGILLGALAVYLVLDHPGVSQVYFLHYGVVAGAILAAWALVDLRRHDLPVSRPRRRGVAGAILAMSLIVGAAALIAPQLARNPVLAFWIPYAVLLAAVLGCAAMLAWRSPGDRRRPVAVGLVTLVMATAAFDAPFDLQRTFVRVLAGSQVAQQDGPGRRGVTNELLEGLRWLRDNTDADAIVAVNNPYLRRSADPRSFLVSGFGERRAYLEGWAYTAEGQQAAAERLQGRPGHDPFADRRAVNAAVFERADPTAAETLRAAGVRYLFVDRWMPTPQLDPIGTLVFENPAVRIYRLR